jgi:hypothetical protein
MEENLPEGLSDVTVVINHQDVARHVQERQ